MQRPSLTCITHVIVKRCMREMTDATSIIAWFRIAAAFVFGSGFGVCTQVPSLH